jgi:hypothetical protein
MYPWKYIVAPRSIVRAEIEVKSGIALGSTR